MSVDEKTFQVPKREALGALAAGADLALVVRNRFEREDVIVTGKQVLRLVNTLCASDFLVWDYDSARVVAEGPRPLRKLWHGLWSYCHPKRAPSAALAASSMHGSRH